MGLGAVGYFLLDRGPRPLVKLPDAPHPEVTVHKSDPKPSLLGLRPALSAHQAGDAARAERNRIANLWIRALADLEAGQTNQGAVERIEMDLWVQRVHTAEVKPEEAHQALARLFTRELERRKQLFKVGFASEEDVRRAEVLLAREKYAAGQESDYPTRRTSYLAKRRHQIDVLARAGVMVKDVAIVEMETLEAELPAPEVLRPPTVAP